MGTPVLWPPTVISVKFLSSSYKVLSAAKLCDCFSFKNKLLTGLGENLLSFVLVSASRYKAKSPEGFHLARSKYNGIRSYFLKYFKILKKEI